MLGKGALILVMGAAAILTMLILNLNANATSQVETTTDFYKQTQVRLISNSGVEIYLEKLRRDKDLKGSFDDNDLLNGTYDILIYGPDSALVIRSAAKYEGVDHTSVVTAKREPITMPQINSAIYVSASNLSLQMSGNNIAVDGNDHNTDGNPGPNPPIPGFGVDNPTDSDYVVKNVYPKIDRIDGAGGTPSVKTVKDTTDWLALTENIIFAADITLPSGSYSSGTYLGDPSHPKVIYADGDVHFSGTMSGDGIMVVNGNLTLSGQFTFRGIIIVYGQSSIQTDIVGQGTIFGSTICVGTNVDIKAAGNASLFYSSQAINNAKLNLKSSRFEILSWWE